jgi:hypothetical protein
VPAVPVLVVLTKQQAEHQSVIMVAEHRRRQEEDLMQMVFRLNAAVQHQGGQVVSSDSACSMLRSQARSSLPQGSLLHPLQYQAQFQGSIVVFVLFVASIFTSGPVFGNSPTQRAQDFQAFTADTIQTFLGPSSSAGSVSDPINIDITNKKRTDRAGGSGIEVLESENTQEQLRTGQVKTHVLVLHVSWHYLLI